MRIPLWGGVEHYKELVVKKATDSFGGHGVSFISQQKGSIYEQLKEIDAEIAGDIVIQAPILQHPDMAKLHKESINTIRAFSFLTKQGDVKIYSVIVRIGVGSSRVDNASSGGITCGVEKDGSIKPVAFTPKGDRFTEHPTTGFHFEQVKIPNYSNVLETIRKLHTQIPHFRFASWDIAIDQEGDPVLIEVNLRAGELDFHQLNNGPIFGEDTKTVLNEVFGQKI